MKTVITNNRVLNVASSSGGIDDHMSKFLRKSFSLPDKPSDYMPTLPDDLDELTDSGLMALYSRFMAWVSYTKGELVSAEIAEDRAMHNLKVTEAHAIIVQTSDKVKGDTVTLAKARRDVDPAVLMAQDKYLEARAYRKLTEVLFEGCERGAQVLSRELSRRIGLAPKENRQAKYLP